MEAVIKLTDGNFDDAFLQSLKRMFEGRKDLEITISVKNKPASAYLVEESRAEYFSKLDKAIKDVEAGNVVSFTGEEFEAFVKEKFQE